MKRDRESEVERRDGCETRDGETGSKWWSVQKRERIAGHKVRKR